MKGGGLALVAGAFVACEATASHERTQRIELDAGWNAVYLYVHPNESVPSRLFADTVVDVASSYDQTTTLRQFSTNPAVDKLRQLGWGIWYAPQRPDAFLSDLGAVYGGKAYLLHATEDGVLEITGRVNSEPISWRPDAFNLVGFTLSDDVAPTYASFFRGSSAHAGRPVHVMRDGVWLELNAPDSEAMRDGEAFWVRTDSSSTFQGPLAVEAGTGGELVLGSGIGDIVLRNVTDHPVQVTLEHVPPSGEGVPLSVVIEVLGEDNLSLEKVPVFMGLGAWTQSFPELEAGEAIRVPLQVRAATVDAVETTSLLCVKTDLGTETWIPVTGLQEDVP